MKQIRASSASRQLNATQLEEKLSHPVKVLRLIAELYTQTDNIRLALQPTDISEGTYVTCVKVAMCNKEILWGYDDIKLF